METGILLFDAADRLEDWTAAVPEILPELGGLLEVGIPFEEISRRIGGNATSIPVFGPGGLSMVRARHPSDRFAAMGPINGVRLLDQRSALGARMIVAIRETPVDGVALGDNEASLQSLSEAMPLAMVISRLDDGAILYVNRRMAELFGADREELLRMRTPDLFEDRTDRDRLVQMLRRYGSVTGYEVRGRRGDGVSLWVTISARTLPYRGEEAVFTVLADVTERKEAEQKLEAARREADRAAYARNRFFAAASHDLRQPLAALSLFTGALENRSRDLTSREIIKAMNGAIQAMKSLVDGHLDMARLDAGVLKVQPATHPVNALLTRMAIEFAPLVQEKGLRLSVHPSSALIRTDRDLLERVLRNLLSNAVRYTERGRVVLGCRRRGDVLRIEVWDTGVGISPDQLQTIFDEFFQDNGGPSNGGGGLGLGLSIVDRVTRLLGHRVDVRSVPGRGSVFAVAVPLADDGEDAPSAGEGPVEETDVSRARVVVIEDDVSVLQALEMLLQQWGCAVVAAASFDEAMDTITTEALDPDLIIADYRLRGEATGISAIRRIAKALDKDLPGLIITGDTDPTRQREAKLSGYPLLYKPVMPLALRTAVARLLGRERLNPL